MWEKEGKEVVEGGWRLEDKEDRGEGRERSGGAQAASPPRSPSNPPAASGGAPCEGDRRELQACHVECGTGTFRSQDRSQDAGACYPPPQPPCLPPSSQLLP